MNHESIAKSAINTLQAHPLTLWMATMFGTRITVFENRRIYRLNRWRGKLYFLGEKT